jgi:VanZ family protein
MLDFYSKSILPSILWTVVIFFLLGRNSHNNINIVGLDKLVHFILFFLFTFFWGNYLKQFRSAEETTIFLLLLIVGSSYGMGMEYYQKFFTNRSFSYWDGLADALGSVVGAWAAKKSPYGNRGRNQN